MIRVDYYERNLNCMYILCPIFQVAIKHVSKVKVTDWIQVSLISFHIL